MSNLVLMVETLTPRESEVLDQLADGLSNTEIGVTLVISEKTVRSHLRTIFSKLGATTRLEAVLSAHSMGLVTLPGELTPEQTAVLALEHAKPGTIASLRAAGLI